MDTTHFVLAQYVGKGHRHQQAAGAMAWSSDIDPAARIQLAIRTRGVLYRALV